MLNISPFDPLPVPTSTNAALLALPSPQDFSISKVSNVQAQISKKLTKQSNKARLEKALEKMTIEQQKERIVSLIKIILGAESFAYTEQALESFVTTSKPEQYNTNILLLTILQSRTAITNLKANYTNLMLQEIEKRTKKNIRISTYSALNTAFCHIMEYFCQLDCLQDETTKNQFPEHTSAEQRRPKSVNRKIQDAKAALEKAKTSLNNFAFSKEEGESNLTQLLLSFFKENQTLSTLKKAFPALAFSMESLVTKAIECSSILESIENTEASPSSVIAPAIQHATQSPSPDASLSALMPMISVTPSSSSTLSQPSVVQPQLMNTIQTEVLAEPESHSFQLAQFWSDISLANLTSDAFFQHFRKFLFSDWETQAEAEAASKTDTKSEKQELLLFLESTFQAQLRCKAIQIMQSMHKCLEADVKIASTYTKEEKELSKQEYQTRAIQTTRKTNAKAQMLKIFKETYQQTYLSYIDEKKALEAKAETDVIDNFNEKIAIFIKKRNLFTRGGNNCKPDTALIKKLRSNAFEYLNQIEKEAKQSFIPNPSILGEMYFAPTVNDHLHGQKLTQNQARLVDIIMSDLTNEPALPLFRHVILNPIHSYPKRHYLTKIPLSYCAYQEALFNLRSTALALAKREKLKLSCQGFEQLSFESRRQLKQKCQTYFNARLKHQSSLEIVSSGNIDIAPKGVSLNQLNRKVKQKKERLMLFESNLTGRKIEQQTTLNNLGIDSMRLNHCLTNFVDKELQQTLYESLSKEKYQKLTGAKYSLNESIQETFETEATPIASLLTENEISSLTKPTRTVKKEDLNSTEMALFIQLQHDLRINIRKHVHENITQSNILFRYHQHQQIINFYFLQAALLELKLNIANYIEKNELAAKKPFFQAATARLFKHYLLPKAVKFAKRSIKYRLHSSFLEKRQLTAQNVNIIQWMSYKNKQLNVARESFNRVQEKFDQDSSRVDQSLLNTLFQDFLDSNILEEGLATLVINLFAKQKTGNFVTMEQCVPSPQVQNILDKVATENNETVEPSQFIDMDWSTDDEELLNFLTDFCGDAFCEAFSTQLPEQGENQGKTIPEPIFCEEELEPISEEHTAMIDSALSELFSDFMGSDIPNKPATKRSTPPLSKENESTSAKQVRREETLKLKLH